MATGYVALVLHAHLPFVRHPESDYVLEEEWLYEAITETYIPLLRVFEGLKQDGIDFKITMSMTPPLVSMLRDPLLQERYSAHLAKLQELVALEVERNAHNGHIRYLAEHYITEFNKARELWERYNNDLVTAFKQFQDTNNLEIITCGATHGYLPLMKMYPQAVWAQIQVACEHYEQTFGRPNLAAMPPSLLKPVLLFLVEIMNLPSKCGLLRWVIPVQQNIESFIKTWVGKRNMSISSLISCPMVSAKTRVLNITKLLVVA